MDCKDALIVAEECLGVVLAPPRLTAEAATSLTQTTLKYWRDHVNAGFLTYRKTMGDGDGGARLDWCDMPTSETTGSAWVLDAHGVPHLDCLSGFGIFNVGHSHPQVLAAVHAQLYKQPLHSQEFLDPLRAHLAKLLSTITPGNGALSHSFFVNSGAEAVEAALKLAIAHTGRHRILACLGGFHGKTMGALSTTSKALFRKPFVHSLGAVDHIPFNDAEALQRAFESAAFTGNPYAAFIVEPVQGEGGIHVSTTEFLATARQLCTAHGTCMIADEVQTGMGRTGAMFACSHYGVVPDLLCIGKSLSGGVVPIAACCGTAALWAKCVEAPFLFTTTFGGNPLACAAAIAAISVILRDRLDDNARTQGMMLKAGLENIAKMFPRVMQEVRGMGLMLGVQFVNDAAGVAWSTALLKKRVIVSGTLIAAQCVRVCPPLVITPAEIALALKHMHAAAQEADAVVSARL